MKGVKGAVYAIISSATFGLIPLFAKNASNAGMGIESILFYRFGISTFIFGIYMLIRGNSFRLKPKQILPLVLLGGLCYGGTSLFLLLSYNYIPCGAATTIHFLYPVMVVAIMGVFFREKLTLGVAIAMMLSLLGVFFLSSGLGEAGLGLGLLFAAITVVTYAIYIVGLKHSGLKSIDSHTLTFYVLAISTIILFAIAQSTSGLSQISSPTVGFNLLGLAVISTIISNFTLILAVKEIGSTPTSILGTLEPLTAILVGLVCFNEKLSATAFFGAILVILSVVVIVVGMEKKRSRKKAKLS